MSPFPSDPEWLSEGQKHPLRTTSERMPTQHPETSAEVHTELARAEFPVLGCAAMTRSRRLQYRKVSDDKSSAFGFLDLNCRIGLA